MPSKMREKLVTNDVCRLGCIMYSLNIEYANLQVYIFVVFDD